MLYDELKENYEELEKKYNELLGASEDLIKKYKEQAKELQDIKNGNAIMLPTILTPWQYNSVLDYLRKQKGKSERLLKEILSKPLPPKINAPNIEELKDASSRLEQSKD